MAQTKTVEQTPVETPEQELARLRAENESLRKKAQEAPQAKVYAKVAPAGGVSVYGLQRMPVTLFQEQWVRLLTPALAKEILGFIQANQALLNVKGDEAGNTAKAAARAAKGIVAKPWKEQA